MSGRLEVSVREGKVFLETPDGWVSLEPQVAFQVGEAVARAAHEARFGESPADQSYLASQIRARVTDDLREKMVMRVALMLISMREEGRDMSYQARQVVDTLFAEVM